MSNKSLSCYDIDDTVFFANQSIIVVDRHGNEIEHIDHDEYKRREDAGEHHYDYSWRMLENSEDFCRTLKPNLIVCEQLCKDLADENVDVVFITARTSPDNIKKFRSAFGTCQIEIEGVDIIFAGDNSPGNRSWLNKRVEFEKIMRTNKYNNITLYDDSRKNLDEFYYASLDYPVTIYMKWINSAGEIIPIYTVGA